jgi:hypothetical protein
VNFSSKEARYSFMRRLYYKYGHRESRKGTIVNILV